MNRLFYYGTLQRAEVQQAVFGHSVTGTRDAVIGYRLRTITLTDERTIELSGSAQHTILEYTGVVADEVEGTVLSVSDRDLQLADQYEPLEYTRTLAKLRSGDSSWVYVKA